MKRIASILVCLTFIGLTVFGQDIQITGTVTSADDGSLLPGVAIQVKGTSTGTATNIDGEYTIKAPSDAILVFSSIGMITQEVAVEGRSTINVVMETEIAGLEEVIVVAYGTTTREALTGSVGVVSAENIENVPIASIDKILKGNTPGMQITSASGQPGSFADVRIRGINSINAGSTPLFVVDGVPITSGTLARAQNTDTRDSQTEHQLSSVLSNLNPNDIESVTILKDAVATSLYGTRASNGVVLITTKSGKEGKTKFLASSQYGFSKLATNNMEVLNSSEYVELQREAIYNFYIDQGLSELEAASLATREAGPDSINTDWMDYAFNNKAPTWNFELSASGGTEKTKFYVSGGYFDQTGIALGSEFKRYSGRVNLSHRASDRISFGLNFNPSFAHQLTPLTSAAYFISPVVGGYMYRPNVPAYNPDGTPYFDLEGPMGGANFLGVYEYNESYSNTLKLLGNFYAEVELLKNLKYKISLGGDYSDVREYAWDDPRNPGNTAEGKGRATRNYTNQFIGTITNMLMYAKTIGENHNINLMLAHEAQNGKYEATDVSTLNFPHPDLRELGSGAENEDSWGTSTEFGLLSYFGRFEYNFSEKYYFFSSLRYDGSSRLGENNRFAPFYGIGASWRITREDFMANQNALNNLKLRVSYGTSGNQDILFTNGAPNYYGHQGLYGYGANYNGEPGSAPSQIANPDLKWEQSAKFNTGLDFGIFNRISGTFDYYYSKTTDLLLYVPVSRTSGFNEALRNVGSMQNQGMEFAFSAVAVKSSGFNWNIDFNIAHNENEILALNNHEDIIDGTKIRREGEPFQTFYMPRWAGVNPATGEAMWYDENGNVTMNYNSAKDTTVGNADPKFYGGFTNVFEYKGFSLSIMFYYQYGNKIYNSVSRITESDGAFSGMNQDRKQLDRWQQPGDYSPNPRRVDGNSSNSNQLSTRWLEDGSYLRLKNITFAYNFPSQLMQKAKLNSLRLFVIGTNLWTLTNYSGLDPEQAINGTSWFVYPNTRTITFGLELGF